MTESLLLTTAKVLTFYDTQLLTGASGFFFERDDRLFYVTSRHVLTDAPSRHFPNRIEIEMHTDAQNLALARPLSILLYQNGWGIWRQRPDVDVAVIEIDRSVLCDTVAYQAFTPEHLQCQEQEAQVGNALLIVGFPLGFHDTLHHLPVVRNAIIASSYGLRFQGQGYFMTDARTHRGSSGAPVVMRYASEKSSPGLPWKLLGVHSARMDMSNRDMLVDESLGLNCAWYADVLMELTS